MVWGVLCVCVCVCFKLKNSKFFTEIGYFQEIIFSVQSVIVFPHVHVCGWNCEGLQSDVTLSTLNSVQPTPTGNWNGTNWMSKRLQDPWQRGPLGSTQDLLPTPRSLHKGSFPIPHSLMFPQKFLGVIHSAWFLCLPPPNHLDPIYKPQTAQEFMQGLFLGASGREV